MEDGTAGGAVFGVGSGRLGMVFRTGIPTYIISQYKFHCNDDIVRVVGELTRGSSLCRCIQILGRS